MFHIYCSNTLILQKLQQTEKLTKLEVMKQQEKDQLKLEIQHIFDSGANEIRIFEMVNRFIERRYKSFQHPCNCLRPKDTKTVLTGYVAAEKIGQKVDLDHFAQWYEDKFGFKLSERAISEYKRWEVSKENP